MEQMFVKDLLDATKGTLLCGKEEAYLVPSATALLPFCFSKSDLI